MTTRGERRKLAILGAGPFAEEIADLVSATNEYEPVAFVEGIDRERCRSPLRGLPVVWIDDVGQLAASCQAVCAVGTPKREGFIHQALAHGLRFGTLVHPSACVSATATLGAGTIVSAATVIAAYASIGQHVIVNRGCLIGHHTAIGDFATISPGANIAGGARIGDRCYVGMGAIVVDGVVVGSGAMVGAGAVVTRDVPERVLVMGAPARAIKRLTAGDGA
jgi:sugar O-acyltransferase (sialic acid O-acetyltransferase NeuD family)